MLALIYIIKITLPFSPVIIAVLTFATIFVAIRVLIRIWDLVGI